MIPPPKKKNEDLEKDMQNQERRKHLQRERMKEYEVEVKTVRKRIEKTQRYFLIHFQVKGKLWLFFLY